MDAKRDGFPQGDLGPPKELGPHEQELTTKMGLSPASKSCPPKRVPERDFGPISETWPPQRDLWPHKQETRCFGEFISQHNWDGGDIQEPVPGHPQLQSLEHSAEDLHMLPIDHQELSERCTAGIQPLAAVGKVQIDPALPDFGTWLDFRPASWSWTNSQCHGQSPWAMKLPALRELFKM